MALKNVTLSIGPGMFGLLGPNGAGKTTLMKILVTLLTPTSGQINILGYDLAKQAHKIRSDIGYLPQDFGIYKTLTGREFLDYVGCLKGITSKNKRKKQIETLLEQVSLSNVANRQVKTYSGGMRQRLGIAQALLGNPRVLVIDEPTAGLDPAERIKFRNLLAELGNNHIILLSTHIVGDIERSCQNLAVLSRGNIVFSGFLEDFCNITKNKVWEVDCTDDELYNLKQAHNIVASKRTLKGICARMISNDSPHPLAHQVESSIEDAYMYLQGGEA